MGDAGFLWGTFWKKSPTPPKNSPKKNIATHGRKCEQRASFFCTEKGSFRVPLLQYRFWFVPLPLIDFFEASPYGVLVNSGGLILASLYTREAFLSVSAHLLTTNVVVQFK